MVDERKWSRLFGIPRRQPESEIGQEYMDMALAIQQVTEDHTVMNELIRRGHGLRVQSEREGADAVIDGLIKSFTFSGVLLDDKGRARIFEVTITAAVTVRDQHENRVLYDNQNFVFRGEFEFANDPRNFFNEEDPAVMRMARSFAESIVSTLVNGFGVKE